MFSNVCFFTDGVVCLNAFQWGDKDAAQPDVRACRFRGQDVWGAASVGGELHHSPRCWLQTLSSWLTLWWLQRCATGCGFILCNTNVMSDRFICFVCFCLCVKMLHFFKIQEHNWRRCTTCGWSGQMCWISVNTGTTAAVEQSCGGCRRRSRCTPPRSVVWCCWLTTGWTPTVASREVRGHVECNVLVIFIDVFSPHT